MAIYLFSFEPPYAIFLIITIIFSSIKTHKKWLCYINMTSLALLCFYYLLISLSYIDAWLGLIISLILINNKMTIGQRDNKLSPSRCALNMTENKIYEASFKNYFTKEQFKYLFNKGKMVKIKTKFLYATEGEPFNKIFYFASISTKNGVLMYSNNIQIHSIESDSWVGIVEFLNYQKDYAENDNQRWKITIAGEIDNCEVCYFEWDKEIIKNIFLYSIDHSLLNQLLLMWNKSNSILIGNFNQKLYTIISRIGTNNTPSSSIIAMNPSTLDKRTNKVNPSLFFSDSIRENGEDEDLQEPLLSTSQITPR